MNLKMEGDLIWFVMGWGGGGRGYYLWLIVLYKGIEVASVINVRGLARAGS